VRIKKKVAGPWNRSSASGSSLNFFFTERTDGGADAHDLQDHLQLDGLERRGEKLFNNGEELGNCLGNRIAQAVSGRLPL